MENAKLVMTPTSEEKESENDEELLEGKETTWYRGVAARGIYLSLDRPDTAFASKEASKRMSKTNKSRRKEAKEDGEVS